MKLFRVYTKKMAAYLCQHGFTVVEVIADKNKPQFSNWLFEDTHELRLAITNYTFTH